MSGPAASDPVSPARLDEMARLARATAVPVAELEPAGPGAAGRSRIGGPASMGAGEAWPVGPDGQPLAFVAQIDLTGTGLAFPFAGGLVRLFCGTGPDLGADPGFTGAGACAIVAAPADAATAEVSGPTGPARGRAALEVRPGRQPITLSCAEAGPVCAAHGQDPARWAPVRKRVWNRLVSPARTRPHQVGGWPTFRQFDPRTTPRDWVLVAQLDAVPGVLEVPGLMSWWARRSALTVGRPGLVCGPDAVVFVDG